LGNHQEGGRHPYKACSYHPYRSYQQHPSGFFASLDIHQEDEPLFPKVLLLGIHQGDAHHLLYHLYTLDSRQGDVRLLLVLGIHQKDEPLFPMQQAKDYYF
jgi:hypothetical protein